MTTTNQPPGPALFRPRRRYWHGPGADPARYIGTQEPEWDELGFIDFDITDEQLAELIARMENRR